MTRLALFVFIGLAALFLSGCGPAGGNSTSNNGNNANNVNAAARSAAPADKTALVELEKNAFEAWKNKDGNFFEGFLTDNFTMFGPTGRLDKAASITEIRQSNCEVNSYSFADEAMTVLGGDAAAVTMKVTTDAVCGGQKQPSPRWSATVFVRDGDKWKAAYHNEIPVMDPNAKTASEAKPPNGAKAEEKPADPMTAGLLEIEKKVWEAWKNRDVKTLAQLTLLDLVYVDPMGTGRYKRDEAIKSWIGPDCNVKSVSLSDAQSKLLTANLALLTFKGAADGTCGGKPILPVWGTTLYMKEVGYWKAIMIFNSPL